MSQKLKDDLKVVMLERRAACDVCGCRMHERKLRLWNGKAVCDHCIRGLNEEAENYTAEVSE